MFLMFATTLTVRTGDGDTCLEGEACCDRCASRTDMENESRSRSIIFIFIFVFIFGGEPYGRIRDPVLPVLPVGEPRGGGERRGRAKR